MRFMRTCMDFEKRSIIEGRLRILFCQARSSLWANSSYWIILQNKINQLPLCTNFCIQFAVGILFERSRSQKFIAKPEFRSLNRGDDKSVKIPHILLCENSMFL